jgi:ribose 5-phosphate isomerase A
MSWRTRAAAKLLGFTQKPPAQWSRSLGLSSSAARDGSLAPRLALLGFGAACFSSATSSHKPIKLATQEELKKQAGYKAVDDFVKSGMEQAEGLGIPLATLDTHSKLDVAIDGADAVDPALNLVKGGGGAHFREKIVEMAATLFVVIVDDSKLCPALGPSFAIPVEIVPFCHEHTIRKISELPALDGCTPVLRLGSSSTPKPDGDKIAVSDNGNYIVDLYFDSPMKDPRKAGSELSSTIGVVEHGLFIDMATTVIVAGRNGIQVANRKMGWW